MSLMGKLKAVAGVTVAAFGIHAYTAGTAATPGHHGGSAQSFAAAPSARPGSNEALANQMAASLYGWRGSQAGCLDALWTRESGFSQYADTRRSHAGGDGPGSAVFAYGIAQARPATKYPLAGGPPTLAAVRTG